MLGCPLTSVKTTLTAIIVVLKKENEVCKIAVRSLGVQVFLDVGVPTSVYETMRSEVMKFPQDNPKSYMGKGQVINCSAWDPMKVQLGFFFEYAHCG